MNDDNTETELDPDLGESDYDREILSSDIINYESEDITRVGTIFQSSSETPFKLFRVTVALSHLEKLSFAQARANIATATPKNQNGGYLGQALIGPKIKIS